MVCNHATCSNLIWQEKVQPATRCRRCGTWWPTPKSTGKGKGQGDRGKQTMHPQTTSWPRKTYQEALMDTPPGLTKLRPLKKGKDQQAAAELLASTWDVIPEGIQGKLQPLGLGPPPQEEPELTDLLKTHMAALPQAVQEVVTKMTQQGPDTEKDCQQAQKPPCGKHGTSNTKANLPGSAGGHHPAGPTQGHSPVRPTQHQNTRCAWQ